MLHVLVIYAVQIELRLCPMLGVRFPERQRRQLSEHGFIARTPHDPFFCELLLQADPMRHELFQVQGIPCRREPADSVIVLHAIRLHQQQAVLLEPVQVMIAAGPCLAQGFHHFLPGVLSRRVQRIGAGKSQRRIQLRQDAAWPLEDPELVAEFQDDLVAFLGVVEGFLQHRLLQGIPCHPFCLELLGQRSPRHDAGKGMTFQPAALGQHDIGKLGRLVKLIGNGEDERKLLEDIVYRLRISQQCLGISTPKPEDLRRIVKTVGFGVAHRKPRHSGR